MMTMMMEIVGVIEIEMLIMKMTTITMDQIQVIRMKISLFHQLKVTLLMKKKTGSKYLIRYLNNYPPDMSRTLGINKEGNDETMQTILE